MFDKMDMWFGISLELRANGVQQWVQNTWWQPVIITDLYDSTFVPTAPKQIEHLDVNTSFLIDILSDRQIWSWAPDHFPHNLAFTHARKTSDATITDPGLNNDEYISRNWRTKSRSNLSTSTTISGSTNWTVLSPSAAFFVGCRFWCDSVTESSRYYLCWQFLLHLHLPFFFSLL